MLKSGGERHLIRNEAKLKVDFGLIFSKTGCARAPLAPLVPPDLCDGETTLLALKSREFFSLYLILKSDLVCLYLYLKQGRGKASKLTVQKIV